MMKKFGLSLLALMMALAMLLSFTACGDDAKSPVDDDDDASVSDEKKDDEKDDDKKDENKQEEENNNGGINDEVAQVKSTVTKTEWKRAFDMSRFTNYTVKGKEVYEEEDETYEYGVSFQYDDGIVKGTATEVYLGETETTEAHTYFDIESIADFGLSAIAELQFELEYLDDYGYSLFDYSESKKQYSATISIDDIETFVTISFEDGKIVKITMKGGNEEGTFEANVTISKYGTTASLPAPKEE